MELGNYFQKININNLHNIFHFLDIFTLAECSFLNKKFKSILLQKFPKKLPLVIICLKKYKKQIKINCSSDLIYYLSQNSFKVSKEIKRQIIKEINDENITYIKTPILERFFKCYPYKNKFTKIDFKNCNIGRKSLKYLSYILQGTNQAEIDKIDLSENKLNSKTLEPLTTTFNPYLKILIKKLKLDKSLFDVNTMKYLSQMNIEKLYIRNSDLDISQINYLQSTTITKLNFSGNSLTSNFVLAICKNLPNLNYLNLSNNSLTDLSIYYICLYLKKPECKLTSIILSYNQITTNGFIGIISLISEKQIKLDKLNLKNNIIDNIPNELLSYENVQIKNFKIGENKFTPEDFEIFIEFVLKNPYITTLDLSGLILKNVSIQYMFFKLNNPLFNNNNTNKSNNLKKLKMNYSYLGQTNMNENLFSYFSNAEITQKIKEFSFSYNNILLKNFNKVFQFDLIETLNLEGNDLNIYEDDLLAFFDFILKSQVIKELNLNNNYLGKFGNDFLMKLSDENCKSSLEKLYLKENKISNLNIELTNILINNKNLKYLYLNNNDISSEIENGYFFHSAENSEMALLSLKENKIGLSFIEKLNKYIKDNENAANNWSTIIDIRSKSITESYIKNKEENIPLIEKIKCL